MVINRFGFDAISLEGNGGNVVEGNFIGTDPTGTLARPNGSGGIRVFSAGNRIGGLTAAARNVISGNQATGIAIQNSTATGNVVQGNYIGLNAAGTAALPNGGRRRRHPDLQRRQRQHHRRGGGGRGERHLRQHRQRRSA